jgi:hypothetical protein
MKNLTVKDAQISDTGDALQVRLALSNDGDRTLYAVAKPRGYDWEADARRLIIRLHDVTPRPDSRIRFAMFVPPAFKALEAGRTTELSFVVPRVLRTAMPSGEIATWPAHEAQAVRAILAVAEGPFYADIRAARDDRDVPREMLASSASWGVRVEIEMAGCTSGQRAD